MFRGMNSTTTGWAGREHRAVHHVTSGHLAIGHLLDPRHLLALGDSRACRPPADRHGVSAYKRGEIRSRLLGHLEVRGEVHGGQFSDSR